MIPVLGHTDNPTSDPIMYKHITDLWKLWLPSEALETFSSGKTVFVFLFLFLFLAVIILKRNLNIKHKIPIYEGL